MMPGSLRNKAFGLMAGLLAAYFFITDPVGSGHAVKAFFQGLSAFLGALRD